MDLDINALVEDTALARVQLWRAHCEHAEDPSAACVGLASQLLHQALIVLEAAYGDKAKARQHALLTFAGG